MARRPKTPPPPKTQAELARLLGVRRQTVGKWVAAGLPAPPSGQPWDVSAVRAWRRDRVEDRVAASLDGRVRRAAEQSVRLRRTAPASVAEAEQEYATRVAGGESPRAIAAEAVTRYRLARAKAAELELERVRGRLVERTVAEDRVVDILRGLRAMLLEVPRRVDVELASATDPLDCGRIVEDQVIGVLATIQQQHGVRVPPRCPQCSRVPAEESSEHPATADSTR